MIQEKEGTQVKLVKVTLKEGSKHLWFEWCEELKKRREEVIETLKNEWVLSESCFLSEDEKCIYYFMEATSFEKAKEAVMKSIFPIDADHQKIKKLCFEEKISLKELFHFENRN